MDKILHNAADLPTSQRTVVESIIGHSLHDDQQVYIVAIDAAAHHPPTYAATHGTNSKRS